MAAECDEVEASIDKIFHSWDLNSNGFIEKSELATCCSELHLSEEQLEKVFKELDNDGDGQISLSDFHCGFRTVCSLFQVDSREEVYAEISDYKKFEKLLDSFGVRNLLTGQDYISELFHCLHSSSDSPQLLTLLESFLFSVVRDVKHFSEENHRLEDALKRTCEKHAEHMEQLDDELEQQMSRLESRVRKEERSKSERQNLDVVWQLESKNKELQTLNTKIQKLETKLKKKQPEEQKLKDDYDERIQEIRYLKSQLTDSQTNLAILRSELVQLRDRHDEQSEQLEREKATVLDCVQEQESLTRQLHLLHEANKKLHDTNDDLRSALEMKKSSAKTSPLALPNKRHSISVLSFSSPSKKSSRSSSRRASYHVSDEPDGNNREDPLLSASGPPCFGMTSTPLERGSSRRASLLPSQQTCEVDDENESSLLNELMVATRSSTLDFGADDEEEMDEAYSTMSSNERDALQQQLRILQESNKDLRMALKALSKKGRSPKSKSRRSEDYRQQPSVHSDYGSISSRSITPSNFHGPKSDEDAGDGVDTEELSGYEPEDSTVTQSESLPESEHSTRQDDLNAELEAQFKSVIEEDEEDLDEYDVGDEELAKLVAMTSADTDETDSDPDTETELPEERGTAVGADSLSETSSNTLNTTAQDQNTPERIYRLVLAGDAAVGKSSFILRLCRNRFHTALNSTLGVDFQMKAMEIDGKNIALQLWDTAGQERFRSIAKSYFRKADGVLLLYDVTCETSFLNVREWVDAIEESSSKSIPIMLCGNKTDLRIEYTKEGKSVISAESGQKLAREYGALFCETSSKDGSNIHHACVELTRLLLTLEDGDLKNGGMKLTDPDSKAKKKMVNCCKT